MKSPALRALNAICDPQTAWAITESALQTIVEIAARENPDPAAVAAQLGRPLDNTHDVSIRDGVATIPIEGPLFRHANLMTEISGATSIEMLATDLQAALSDPTVHAIVLSIDSPGGEVNGTSEFADMLYAARATKPITAYVADMGASAAYWIASAADEIVLADTAKVGSIGVVAAMRDPNAGAKSIEFVSSQSPNKRPDPTTEKGRAQIQGMVDDLASVFVQTVARNRGVSPDTVLADFGQGGLFVGSKAVDAGLADSVGSYEGVMARLAATRHTLTTLHAAAATTGVPGVVIAAIEAQEVTPQPRVATNAAGEEGLADAPTSELQATDDSVAEDEPIADKVFQENEMADTETVDTSAQDQLAQALARIAAIEAERDDAVAQAALTAERVAALERESARRELAALAEGWFGSADTHVTIMEALGADARDAYVANQHAVAEQLRVSGLFGSAGVTGTEDESPEAKLNGLVTALQASEPGLDYTAALNRVALQNPGLYAAYRQAVRAATTVRE